MVGGVEIDRAQGARDGPADGQVIERRVGTDTLQLLRGQLELQLQLPARHGTHPATFHLGKSNFHSGKSNVSRSWPRGPSLHPASCAWSIAGNGHQEKGCARRCRFTWPTSLSCQRLAWSKKCQFGSSRAGS